VRLATILTKAAPQAVVLNGDQFAAIEGTIRDLAAAGSGALRRSGEWQPTGGVQFAPVVPDPGAIYTIGHNYGTPGEPAGARTPRPLVYGKAASSVAGHGARLAWDRSLTDNVDAEVELGVVIGAEAVAVPIERALEHVFGYTIINDVSSRDEWLDGDQWLLGKSLPGFCPVGPWLVTADELDVAELRLGCTINGQAVQDGSTSQMRYGIAEIVSYLSRHLTLRPGDLIATGTPARLASPPGPGRRLRAGDEVTAWIEGIGGLSTTIA